MLKHEKLEGGAVEILPFFFFFFKKKPKYSKELRQSENPERSNIPKKSLGNI